MKYIFYNLRNLVKNEKTIFSVMLLCVFISAWTMAFSYGLYQNYHSLRIESDAEIKEINIETAPGKTFTQGELKAFLDSLPSELLNDVNTVYCPCYGKFELADASGSVETMAISRFTVRDGIYNISSYIADMWNEHGMIVSGRYFTQQDEINGIDSIMIDKGLAERSELFTGENTMTLFGKPYNVIGIHASNGVLVPFLSIPSETPVENFTLLFDNLIKRDNYKILQQKAAETAPGKMIFPELPFPDEEQIYIYNNIMAISVLIAALTIINFAFLYNYIFEKRRRGIAIMRICGCTAMRARAICMGECCLICIPVFLIGILTYIPFMKNVLSGVFEYMEASYSPAVYISIFAIYIAMLLLIMGLLMLRQIGQSLSQGQKKEAD